MPLPLGPSLSVAFAIQRGVAKLTAQALEEAWARWLGPQKFARRLARLERARLIATPPSDAGSQRIIQLTEAGELAALGGRNPVALWNRPWDGRWRIVLFDVRESKRSVRIGLQRGLRRLSFGYLQDSVWISPEPIETLAALIQHLPVDAAMLTLLDARPCGGESDADLVSGAWDFSRINRNYQDHAEILRHAPRHGHSHRQAWFQTEWRAWCRALNSDPLLPLALHPAGYRGREAWDRRIDRLRTLLTSV
jgi:phenylacetic acid degradation operon negative regulatory protein